MRHVLILVLALLLPTCSFAAIQAGFPSQAIWVSKQSAVEGETLVVSAVVLNSGSDTLRGTLIFTADDTRIGAREFELPGGKSQIHSIEWKPKRGEYRVAAAIEGTSATLSERETPSIVVSIAAPPPPSAVQQTVTQVVQTAGNIASSSLPAVLGVAESIFNTIEPLRKKGVERLETYLEQSRAASAAGTKGIVSGTSTSNAAGFGPSTNKDKNLLSSIAQAAAASVLVGMKSAALFYPFLAFLFFGVLYYLARRVRRQPRD